MQPHLPSPHNQGANSERVVRPSATSPAPESHDRATFPPQARTLIVIKTLNDTWDSARKSAIFLTVVGIGFVANAFSIDDGKIVRNTLISISQIDASLRASDFLYFSPLIYVIFHAYCLAKHDKILYPLLSLSDLLRHLRHEEKEDVLSYLNHEIHDCFPEHISDNSQKSWFLSSKISYFTKWITVSAFPILVLLLIMCSSMRYQDADMLLFQKSIIIADVCLLLWHHNKLEYCARAHAFLPKRIAGSKAMKNILVWALPLVLFILFYVNVPERDADNVRKVQERTFSLLIQQPFDNFLCPRLGIGCRYLQLKFATLTDIRPIYQGAILGYSFEIGNPLQQPRGRSFRYADFEGSDLSSADLTGADLTGANFANAKMLGVKARGAVFTRSNLSASQLGGFSKDLDYIELESIEGDLRRVNLSGKSLKMANMERAFLNNAKLDYATFDGARLRQANLTGADLRNAQFIGADLRGAILEGNVNLENANLQGTDLRGAKIEKGNLTDAQLQGADLRGVNFEGATLIGAQLRGADLRGANLERADVKGATLNAADLRNADFRAAQFGRTTGLFWKERQNTNLSLADIRGAKLDSSMQCSQPGTSLCPANVLINSQEPMLVDTSALRYLRFSAPASATDDLRLYDSLLPPSLVQVARTSDAAAVGIARRMLDCIAEEPSRATCKDAARLILKEKAKGSVRLPGEVEERLKNVK